MSRNSRRGQKDVRIVDVARLAGVSTATVSRVLTSPNQATPLTQALVMQAVRRTGYVPNRVAQNLRTQRTMMVLAVVPNLNNPVFAEVLRGVDEELTCSGYGSIIGNLDDCDEREERYVDLVLSRQFDGVLLLGGRVPSRGKRSLGKAGVPMAALFAAIPGLKIPQVVVRDQEAGRQAAEYLTQLGHREFGYISGQPDTVSDAERFAGFWEGLIQSGLPDCDLVRWEHQSTFSGGVVAARAFLSMKRRPTGVLAGCDTSAIGFVKTVQAAGLRVPDDVSVIGFDGIEFSSYCEPALTTFQQPLHALGQNGARVLLKLIQGRIQPEDWNVRLPVSLLDRGSTSQAHQSRRSCPPI